MRTGRIPHAGDRDEDCEHHLAGPGVRGGHRERSVYDVYVRVAVSGSGGGEYGAREEERQLREMGTKTVRHTMNVLREMAGRGEL